MLPADEAAHATKVLRMNVGDSFFLLDGKGNIAEAEITLMDKKSVCYELLNVTHHPKPWKGRLHVAMAPTKMMDRVEWFVEKAVEIGIDEISFLECRFSERHNLRIDRLEKIVVSAMKQSRKPYLTKLNDMCSFHDFVTRNHLSPDIASSKFIAHCYEEFDRIDFYKNISTNHDEDITVLIGPEGDFSVDEVRRAIDLGFQSITLGDFRLRTETAALAAVMMSQLSFR